ncbi:MAG: putative bifunctional diguanylate cyclase/phosphodiesterase [Thermoleophilaceae bacterium]
MRRDRAFTPFGSQGRRKIVGILVIFAAFSALSVVLSIRTTQHSQHRAAVLEVAARQRTLAERYVNEVLLVTHGDQADPSSTSDLLAQSADALLNGGEAPGVPGDDDDSKLPAQHGGLIRKQLQQERRLGNDLTAAGRALLEQRPMTDVPLTAGEHVTLTDPVQRLRVLAALTGNTSLNASRTIAHANDQGIAHLITIQVLLGIAGLLVALLLGFALIAAARRQTAHFRTLVTHSSDLVLLFGAGGCRYASLSVQRMVDRSERELLGDGIAEFVHPDDRELLESTSTHGEPAEIVFRMRNRFGEWRQLDAHVTDLRHERRLGGVMLNARDVTERIRLEQELTRQAFHDGLTGLANRALFRDLLDQALARSARTREPLSVLLVDLDGFKQVNDSLGHDAGDRLLEAVAQRFSAAVRPSDTLARLGGDEFGLLLESAGEQDATEVATRLTEELAEPLMISGRELPVGASIGIVAHPGGAAESDDLIRHADIAMYAAKDAGRGHHQVFQYDMAREFGELLALEGELRAALDNGDFQLHYQPEIDVDNRRIVGVEALLRWESATRGFVPPSEFIPIAEATGLILPLGDYVVHEACRQTAAWLKEGLIGESFVTWVNVSAKQLSAGRVSTFVERALEEAGLPPGYLGLEVTETAIVPDGSAGERIREELQQLHDQGVRIAIDDFGTGFSSLGQLRRFPIDVIKVDRSFVQGVEHDAKDAAITANLVTLAHALGLVAIAEGIESNGQLESIQELGCDLAQGFLFARPVPPDEVSHVLAQGHCLPQSAPDPATA